MQCIALLIAMTLLHARQLRCCRDSAVIWRMTKGLPIGFAISCVQGLRVWVTKAMDSGSRRAPPMVRRSWSRGRSCSVATRTETTCSAS
ncbi:hypothetical protein BDU57DRAFT_508729 [Ampelomyces quisqualis]|uniref:Secreted protein n=1 Tax=Ampelomyces quisqualis TaxID=50730 RepID=A0A6A5QXD2_AMPQU|nr:hypothetical protein BDU57DRAFT_508729 [Ampelomyces quisqualis]